MCADRLLPQNIEAEQSVLGSLLIDPDAIIKVGSFLKPDDFYREAHATIYRAILDLHERRLPADFVTVVDELERREKLELVGGPAYLTSLINMVPTSVHVEHYGHIVERTAVMRRLIAAAGQIAALAYEERDEVDEVIDQAERILFEVSQRRISKSLVPIRDVIKTYYDRIEFLVEHPDESLGVFHRLHRSGSPAGRLTAFGSHHRRRATWRGQDQPGHDDGLQRGAQGTTPWWPSLRWRCLPSSWCSA